jgi:hypothetical protein
VETVLTRYASTLTSPVRFDNFEPSALINKGRWAKAGGVHERAE